MKKVIIPVVLVTLVAFVAYKFFYKKESSEQQKEIPLTVSTNDSLTGNVGGALQAYYNLKDAFVKSDTSLVNKEASVFIEKIAQVETGDIKADAAIVELAGQLKQNLANETNNLVTTKELEPKRKVFQVISDQLFDFLRTIGYQGSTVYQQFCPMAFENNGAAWLSNTTEISNPYFGSKMLHCGDVRDSIFTAKK
ncbi:MAG: DUF3347 domain-containing protein [Bacteroidota bacterium]